MRWCAVMINSFRVLPHACLRSLFRQLSLSLALSRPLSLSLPLSHSLSHPVYTTTPCHKSGVCVYVYTHLRYPEATKTHIVSLLHTHTDTHIRALALARMRSFYFSLSLFHSLSFSLSRLLFLSLTRSLSDNTEKYTLHIKHTNTHLQHQTQHHAQMYRHMYTCTNDMQNGDTMELPVIITHTRMCIHMYTYTHAYVKY